MTFTLSEIAFMYGNSKRTTERHIKLLKDAGSFKKTGLGKYYNEPDVCMLAILMGFDTAPKFKSRHSAPLYAKK